MAIRSPNSHKGTKQPIWQGGQPRECKGGGKGPAGHRATSGVKRAFGCREGEVEECAQQCSGGADQSSLERARWSSGTGKLGEWLADRRGTDIREVADEPELHRTVMMLSG